MLSREGAGFKDRAEERHTDGHVEKASGPDYGKEAVNVVKHDEEHLSLGGWGWLHSTSADVNSGATSGVCGE